MNILIVGNGFDLAHDLPTQYKKFLDCVNEIGSIKEDSMPNWKNDIKLKIENNFWIKWFNNCIKDIGEAWIDFEKEISAVIQSFEKLYIDARESNVNDNVLSNKQKEVIMILYNEDYVYDERLTFKELNNSKRLLQDDLNILIECLEIYLGQYVQHLDAKKLSPDIFELDIDCVLSFNYTDTYERLYSCKHNVKYDYIHGKVRNDYTTDINLVLGIDEYLTGEEKDKNTDFISFKKFFQRIHKKTGCKYKEWLNTINDNKEQNHLYIYGHSLDKTDGDILKELICNEYIYTKVYYYDNEAYGKQIANLNSVLGQEKLITMVYDKKIEFIKQQAMISKSDSEWQIVNDIRVLYNIAMFPKKTITKVYSTLKQNIDNYNYKYFNSQKRVIDIFNTFARNGSNISVERYNKLIDICKKLPCNTSDYKSESWDDGDYSGLIECSERTKGFIHKVNEINKQLRKPLLQASEIEFDNINILLSQIEGSKKEEDIVIYIFDILLKKLNEDDINHEEIEGIYECISKLHNDIALERWDEIVNERYNACSSSYLKIRLTHIKEQIEEEKYFEYEILQQIQQFEEDELLTVN